MVKTAPTVAALLGGSPPKDHDIDSITGIPNRINLEQIFVALLENAASVTRAKTVDDMDTHHYGNQSYCHTHVWDVAPAHDSSYCSYLDKYHEVTATADAQLMTQRMDAHCTGVGSTMKQTII